MAEVLITLGILGVLIAMTISTVIKTHQKQVAAAQLKKVYTELNQVIKKVVDEHTVEVLSTDPAVFVKYYIQPLYTNAILYPANKNHMLAMCYNEKDYFLGGKATEAQYASTNYKGQTIGSISTPFYPNHTTSIQLMDGTCIGFNKLYKPNFYETVTIFVDINGSNKPPNRLCRDLFWFYLDQEKHIVVPTEKLGNYDFEKFKCGAKKIMDDGWEINNTYAW